MKAAEPNHCAIFSGVGSICAEVLLSLMPTRWSPARVYFGVEKCPTLEEGVGYLATIVPPNSANLERARQGACLLVGLCTDGWFAVVIEP
jgi:hypothetical protein